MKECKMLICGKWVGSDKYFDVINPYTHELLARVPEATPGDVGMAVESARESFNKQKLPAHRRSEILENTSDLVLYEKEKLARIISTENGKPIKSARMEVERSALTFKFAAEEAKRISGETIQMDAAPGTEKHFGLFIREPAGVVAAITPFNFPLNMVAHKVAPAIAAGNTVVLKPTSASPLTALELGRIMLEAGLPSAHLNIVTGQGPGAGEALVSNEDVNMVTFTGSPPVGRRIKKLAGMAKVTLELGSNSATIIDESAEIEKAVPRCVIGAFSYSGQVCISIQRIYVHENIFDEFLNAFIPRVKTLRIGDPLLDETDLGPMISKDAAMRAQAWIREAEQEGAKVLTGGERNGNILAPTVLSDLKPDMKVVCLEAFAPVVSVIKFREFKDALDMVNQSIYGLQAGVYTRDISNAFRAIRDLHVGGVMINEIPTFRADHMPYGGVKESGIGREGVRFAIEEMTNIKMVSFNLG
ncbi:MAG: aldehyde dehydrogenase family protein [Candidatus Methanoperedens sp.]|nr:aldehyde dehydrogenase family protein [Candidatus Methanoperedens sp.]